MTIKSRAACLRTVAPVSCCCFHLYQNTIAIQRLFQCWFTAMPLSPVSTYVHASFAKFTCSRFCFVLLCIWCLQINWIGLENITRGWALDRVHNSRPPLCDRPTLTHPNLALTLTYELISLAGEVSYTDGLCLCQVWRF